MPALQICAAELSPTSFAFLSNGQDTDTYSDAIRITRTPDETRNTYQLGWQSIRIVTHPDLSVSNRFAETVEAIFSGEVISWDFAGVDAPIILIVPPEESPVARAALSGIGIDGFAPHPNVFLALTPEQMHKAISETPHSIGLLESGIDFGEVEVVRLPNSLQNALRLPIVAQRDNASPKVGDAFIRCLQVGVGQTMIVEIFGD
jgi:hypothetical protein